MRRLTLVLALLLPSVTRGADLRDAIVQVRAVAGNEIHLGSGTVVGRVGNDLIVATAGHVVVEGQGKAQVRLGNRWCVARVIESRPRSDADPTDYAILATPYAGAWPCLPVAESIPAPSESGLQYGYAGGGNRVGRPVSAIRPVNREVEWSGSPSQGMSGGPVLYVGPGGGHALTAIISATDGQHGVGTSCLFLRGRLMARYGRMPESSCNPPPSPPVAVVPTPDPAPPAAAPAPSPTPNVDLDAIKARLASLEARNNAVNPTDIANLWAELAKLQPQPITVQLRSPDGTIKTKTFQPGEPIKIQLPESSPAPSPK